MEGKRRGERDSGRHVTSREPVILLSGGHGGRSLLSEERYLPKNEAKERKVEFTDKTEPESY